MADPPDRKPFLLRLPPELHRELEAWAEQELRSLNGHIEFLLREAVKRLIPAANYGNLKRPFLAPPLGGANPGRFTELLQDTLRGPDARTCPFLDHASLQHVLDRLPLMDSDALTLWSPVLTTALSLVFLSNLAREGYSMADASAGRC